MPDGFWLSLAIIAAICAVAWLDERYWWSKKIVDFMFGPKEKD